MFLRNFFLFDDFPYIWLRDIFLMMKATCRDLRISTLTEGIWKPLVYNSRQASSLAVYISELSQISHFRIIRVLSSVVWLPTSKPFGFSGTARTTNLSHKAI